MPSPTLARTPAFWSVACMLLLALGASGAPTPLFRVYQERFDFSSGVLTVVFGVYAFALLLALLVVGGLSDHVGRRPVLVTGLLLMAGSMVLFLAADGVAWLIAARVLQGLAMGSLTGTLGAALLDTQHADRPLGPVINSASPGIGLSAGAVLSGLILEFVPSPTSWVFGVLTAALLLAAAAVLVLPETSPRRPGARESLRPRVRVPQPQRAAFLTALPVVVAGWALGALYQSLGPSMMDTVFGIDDHLVGALLVLAVQGSSGIAAVSARGLPAERAMVGGALTLAAGVTGTVVAMTTAAVPVLFGAAVVAGIGLGTVFLGTMASVTAGVDPGERAGLISAIFVVGYLSFSAPTILAGFAASVWSLQTVAVVYSVLLVLLALAAVAAITLRRRSADRAVAEAEPAQPIAA
ncbi:MULTISPECIES: MFS transporter [unclassified Blastococcus]